MITGLQALLQKDREKKAFLSAGNSIEDFREEPEVKPLPSEKPINPNSDEHDQCFIVIPDIHSYQRDKKAFNIMMQALPILNAHYNVTKFVQLGDAIECGEASSHPKNNVFDRIPSYLDEVNWVVNEFWKPAMNALPNANFYAHMGNHENRWNKKIASDMGKNGLPQEYAIRMYNELMPSDLYESMGIHVVPYGNEAVNEGILELIPGKLLSIHGWSISKHASHAHLSMLQGGYSIIHGHTHRSQSFVTRNAVTRENVEAWSFGSLAKVEMKWHGGNPNQHTLGFGVVQVHGTDFSISPIAVHHTKNDGRKAILPNGSVIVEL